MRDRWHFHFVLGMLYISSPGCASEARSPYANRNTNDKSITPRDAPRVPPSHAAPNVAVAALRQSLPQVEIPARRKLGAHTVLGLDTDGIDVAVLAPSGTLAAIAGPKGVQLLVVDDGTGIAWRADLACAESHPTLVGDCHAKLAYTQDGARLWVFYPEWRRRPTDSARARLLLLAIPTLTTIMETELPGVYDVRPLDNGSVVGLRASDSIVVQANGSASRFFPPKGSFDSATAFSIAVLDIAANGEQIAVAQNERVAIYDVRSGRQVAVAPDAGHPTKLRLLPDGKGYLATFEGTASDSLSELKLWRPGQNKSTLLAKRVKSWVWAAPSTHVWVTTESPRAAHTDERKSTATRIRLANGAVENEFDALVACEQRVQRATDIVCLANARCLQRFAIADGHLLGPDLCHGADSVLAFDGTDLLSYQFDHIVRYDAQSGAVKARHHFAAPLPPPATLHTVVALGNSHSLAGKVSAALAIAPQPVRRFALSLDNQNIVTNTAVVEVANAKPVRVFAAEADLTLSEDTTQMATVADTKAGGYWSIAMASMVTNQPGLRVVVRGLDPAELTHLRLSPDGKSIATSDGLSTKIFDTATGRLSLRYPCRPSYDGQWGFSQDGAWLTCDSFDTTLILDVARNHVVHRFAHEPDSADAFVVAPDNKWFAQSAHGVLRIFDL